MPLERKWWHTATIYEVYPSSFKDSNNDGVGDIPGIISQIPYLASLGIDAVWLAACYKSSGVDMGYDVVDYQDIDPQYGTVQDVEELIAELGKHGIKLIMDLVVNHTSDEHAWFNESRSSLDSPKRDWYIWRKGKVVDGKKLPPNNWESIFTGSAWEYDQLTDEYYLRIFTKQQPDLNWDNLSVRRAVYKDMHFWLAKGVAGFRMDVINMLSKVPSLPDAPIINPSSYEQPGFEYFCNGPRVHEYLQEMRREVLDHYPDAMTVGEIIVSEDIETIRAYTEPGRGELNMAYQYSLFGIDHGPTGKFSQRDWSLSDFKRRITKWQTGMSYSSGGWDTVWLESHDAARSVTRFGDGTETNRFRVAKLLALMETTLGGTLFVYQGQEISMKNLTPDIPISEYPDVETKRTWDAILRLRLKEIEETGTTAPSEEALMQDVAEQARLKARDHARMPLPWTAASSAGSNAGFSERACKTWSPMNTDSEICNISQQVQDPGSVFHFWRQRIEWRKTYAETLVFGDFEPVEESMGDGAVFAYWRRPLLEEKQKATGKQEQGHRDVLVVLNLTADEHVVFMMPYDQGKSREFFLLHGTSSEGSERTEMACSGAKVKMSAYEGLVFGF